MNKKQTAIYNQWLKSNNLNLFDCYKKPSESKLVAERCVIQSCRKMQGERFRILSHNTYTFTCAFSIEKDGKKYLIWHSPYHYDCFEIPA